MPKATIKALYINAFSPLKAEIRYKKTPPHIRKAVKNAVFSEKYIEMKK